MPTSNGNLERIFLTGYMGAGKSTVGRLLASRLNYLFKDTDQELMGRFKKPIYKIFQQEGEPAFRAAEMNVLMELMTQPKLVVSTGGGTLAREESLVAAREGGTVIYLKAPPEVLFERVIFSRRDRPLLDVPNAEEAFRERLAAREVFYARAHHVVETQEKKPAVIVQEILDWLAWPETANWEQGV